MMNHNDLSAWAGCPFDLPDWVTPLRGRDTASFTCAGADGETLYCDVDIDGIDQRVVNTVVDNLKFQRFEAKHPDGHACYIKDQMALLMGEMVATDWSKKYGHMKSDILASGMNWIDPARVASIGAAGRK